jgi:putative ABC transport system permease protein
MKFTLFSVAVKNLRRKSFRTAVLILSIGLLVSILVFGASFIVSVSSSLERASNRLGADLLVVPVGARDYAEEMLLETKVKVFYMEKDILGRVTAVEGVEQATHQVYLQSILGLCCDIPAAKIVAFDQDSDFIVKPWLTKVLNRRLEKGEAIIGAEAYENLGLLDVQSSVLFNKKYNFVGVLDKTGTGLDNAIFISEENIDDILELGSASLRPDQISLIFTKLEPGYDPEEVGRRIEGSILEVDVIERSDMGKRIVSTLTDINRVFMITIILATLLSAFLAWSVFSAIANERLREIGIMRAIGAEAYENLGLLDVQSSVLFNKKYDFVGVLDKTGTGLDNAIFISEENIDDILELGSASLRPDQISLIFTKLEPGYEPEEVGRRIEGSILEVDVIERSDMGKRIVSTLTDINRVFLITIILATLLSAFLAWSVFSAIANERLREIGIMRAIGARGSHIVWMFVAEVTLLGVLGSLVGIALGTYLSVSLASFFTLIREMSATMTLFERFEVSLIGLLAGSGICLVGALSSIMRFKRLEPLKALKEA